MKKLLTLALLIVSFSASAHAATAKPVEAETIAKVENYLQGLKTGQARFVQTTHSGDQLVGTFYLSRPGKLRFEYDAPVEDFVVADGAFIYFYDGKLKEQTNAPIGTTLADFFLRKDISFGGDVIVKEAKRGGGYLQVQVVQADEPDAGSITFAFTENPLDLKKWRVIDQQGMITEVELFYLKTGMTLDKNLFIYTDPKQQKNKGKKFND
jgi:outer membrane lipoprotein-sorting protein